MPPGKQYLKVKRVSIRDIFLLSRVDLADGKRFQVEDVVAACAACRRVSKRTHWLEAGNICPFCGGGESMLFAGKKDLTAGAEPPVVYSAGGIALNKPGRTARRLLLLAAALILLFALIIPRFTGGKEGFHRTEDGRFYYLGQNGQRYQDGDYDIDGQIFHFENGVLAGESVFEIDRITQITDASGRLRQGWYILNGKFVYLASQGVVNDRVPSVEREGFYELEGLGRVYVTARSTPGNGWVVYENKLYHLRDGRGDPVPDLPGEFGALGEYTPRESGFVQTEVGTYFVENSGLVRSGYVAHAGFVYLLDEYTHLLRYLREGEMPHVASGQTGALIPDEDRMFSCQKGTVIAEARTGMIKTGWLLMDGSLCCAGPEGYLLCGEACREPAGAFDASGRFLPASEGRLQAGGIACYAYPDGTLATGCVKDGDALYLYDDAGLLRVNERIGGVGVTDAAGALHPYAAGMYEIDGEYYCLNQQGAVLTGWQRIGKLYYFDPDTGCRCSAGALVNGVAYPMSRDGYFVPAVEGVYQLDGESYYVLTDGSLATGWRAVDGKLCYFDEQTGRMRADGIPADQTGWIQKNGARFYVFPDGVAARGWQIIDSRVYYFDLQSGAVLTGGQRIDGQAYRFREDGALIPEQPMALAIDGVSIRIGTNGAPEGGFLYAGGHLYYYDLDTATLSATAPEGTAGWISALGGYLIPEREGLFAAGSKTYYLDGAGNVITGWFVRQDSLYYADPATGCIPANEKNEAFGGVFRDGVFTPDQNGIYLADGREYMFMDGQLTSGWVKTENGLGYVASGLGLVKSAEQTIDGLPCRFDANGRYIPSQNVLVPVQGQSTLVLAGGTLPTDGGVYPISAEAAAWAADQNPEIRLGSAPSAYPTGGYLIAVLPGGQAANSVRETGLNAAAYSVRNGFLTPVIPGINSVDGDIYLLREDGAFAVGVCLYQQHLYLFDSVTGVMTRNAYGFGKSGAFSPGRAGLYTVSGQTYYFLDEFGTVGTGFIEDDEGTVRYADENGVLATGLMEINGARYYFFDGDAKYAMARNQFVFGVKDGEGLYDVYADGDGRLVTGFREINGTLRYFDEDGHMLYDTVQDGRYINVFGEVI